MVVRSLNSSFVCARSRSAGYPATIKIRSEQLTCTSSSSTSVNHLKYRRLLRRSTGSSALTVRALPKMFARSFPDIEPFVP